jgi:hypothetical protein
MPGNPSPMQNRNSYKPPGPATAKRTSDGSGIVYVSSVLYIVYIGRMHFLTLAFERQQRTPLAEVQTRQLSGGTDGASDPKRVKLDSS